MHTVACVNSVVEIKTQCKLVLFYYYYFVGVHMGEHCVAGGASEVPL